MKNVDLRSGQTGLSMIEIMIAMVLGAFLLGGVLQIFSSSKQTYRVQEGMSRLQENGRFAMDFITKDIRNADFWGCLKNGLTDINKNLNGADAFPQGVNGSNDAGLNASDTLIMRSAIDSGVTVQPPFDKTITTFSANNGLTHGDILLVSDCNTGDIFQVDTSAVSGSSPPTPGNSATSLSKVYAGNASIYRVGTIIYSIQNGASGQPALFRQINNNAATELVEGIENLQIRYGEDTDADGTPDYYVTANNVVDMDQVVSIRVTLLARTIADNLAGQPVAYTYNGVTTTPADRRLRRVFTSTIAVRNRLL